MYTIVYNGVQNLNKNVFKTRCTKFPSLNIEIGTGYSVHFVCTLYGRKMMSGIFIFVGLLIFPAVIFNIVAFPHFKSSR